MSPGKENLQDNEVLFGTSANCTDAVCIFNATVTAIIFILGLAGNGVVIWITAFKMKKTVNSTWYLSLAVSDFLYCATLPLYISYSITKQWFFGQFMCKFRTFVFLLNMYSSIFLLVIIGVDRCVVVFFPVWAQNKRTVRKASAMVLMAWIVSTPLSASAAMFRNIKENNVSVHCVFTYKTKQRTAVVVSRFIFGFAIPLLIIMVCCVLVIFKLWSRQMLKSTKPVKIMAAVVTVFFVCWLPHHIFQLLKIKVKNRKFYSPVDLGHKVSTTIGHLNSILNPILYTCMGKDFKTSFSSILSRIQSVMENEEQAPSRQTSVFSGSHAISLD